MKTMLIIELNTEKPIPSNRRSTIRLEVSEALAKCIGYANIGKMDFEEVKANA